MGDALDENYNDKLKIVNRNREYHVSKKFICSSVPYFEKMFCYDLLESTENKVTLDFDEHAFDAILNWIHSGLFLIKMDYVISFYEVADYLMINDHLAEPCHDYFHDNFTIKHLPVVLPQVTIASKLINSRSIENFICRHFLKIVNTDIFLDYPVETVETILKLDLMIHSEFQIFESIMMWIDADDSRTKWLPQILKCIRWFFLDPRDLPKLQNNELVKSLANFDSIICSKFGSNMNRSRQNFFVSIHQSDNSKLRINVFDNDLFCLPIGDFTFDDKMPPEFVHGQHISDILFDSGTKAIRIDWVKKTFRWLDFRFADKTYYSQLIKFLVQVSVKPSAFDCYLEDKHAKLPDTISCDESVFLEYNGEFILIGKTEDEKWFGLFPVLNPSWFNCYEDHKRSFRATITDKTVYILTKELEFIRFDMETRNFNKSVILNNANLDFDDLILTSHQANDDKVILINKQSGKMYVFCINEEKWVEEYRFMNVSVGYQGSCVNAGGLIAFTSAFIPMKNIKPLYTQNFCDKLSF